MINRWIIVGRLGADPEMKYTANGNAVTNFTVATDSGFGDRKTTEWVPVVAWNKTAEASAEYLSKGSLVYVEGRAQTRSWEDQQGQKRYKTELVADRVQFLDPKPRGGGDESWGAASAADKEGDIDPESLPFAHRQPGPWDGMEAWSCSR